MQLTTLPPNSLLLVNCNILPELTPYHFREKDLRKRTKFLQRTKDAIWHRWTSEYVRALRERHRLKHSNSKNPFSEGDVVIIKSEERNRHFSPLGVIEKLILGRDGVTRAAKVRSRKTVLQRAIQHLYPLELSCDRPPPNKAPSQALNPSAPSFRPRRDAAVAAVLRNRDIFSEDL